MILYIELDIKQTLFKVDKLPMGLCREVTEHITQLNIPQFPESIPVSFTHQEFLDLALSQIPTLISEYSFAGIFLFNYKHNYRLSCGDGTLLILGNHDNQKFAMLPEGLPPLPILQELLNTNHILKTIPHIYKTITQQKLGLLQNTIPISLVTDRGDFDYLYKRKNLETLSGRKFHKKRNHVNHFINTYKYRTEEISVHNKDSAIEILEQWHERHNIEGDYKATLLALEYYNQLPLIGHITFVEDVPAGFIIGEMRYDNKCCNIHFEKANVDYHGLFQFINKHFTASLSAIVHSNK